MRALFDIRGPRVIVTAVVMLLAGVVALAAQPGGDGGQLRLTAGPARGGQCFGAAALDRHASCRASKAKPVLSPAQAAEDRSAAYRIRANGKDCWSHQPSFPRNTCHFGAKHGRTKVVLVGNSHAGEWLPALQQIAKRKHWKIVTELASQCVMSDVIQMFPGTESQSHCRAWVRHAAVRVKKERPDLIVFANRTSLAASGHSLADSMPTYSKGMKWVFRHWTKIPVVMLRDTPAPGDGGIVVPECLEAHPDDYAACSGLRSTWIPPDPGIAAAKGFKNVRVVNLNNHICGPKICAAVVGRVIPYFDGSHMSATYSRTMAPYLMPHLVAALRHKHR